jgi:putative tryptophan/tyrosine transport system substrate-binding protein
MAIHIERRQFIFALGGAAVVWPLAAHAQQTERMRRIGVLMNLTADDAEGQGRLAAFLQGLQEAGWSVGRNVRVDLRWGAGDRELYRSYVAELVALAPDVILAAGALAVLTLQRASRTIPIVFVNVIDPVGAGFIDSLSRPGGNATGFTIFEFSMGGKWLELLKQIAPGITRAALLRDPSLASGAGQFGAIQTVAPSFGVELRPVDVRDADEIERGITAFAGDANGGLIVTQHALAILHRKLIITLAARHRLPAIYPYSRFVTEGGLISYGPDSMDGYRRAAGYVDRILNGAKPADLPVQAPVKYELAINLKTAKALGLDVPPTVLARATEVIE